MPKTFLVVLALLLFSTSASADQITVGHAGFYGSSSPGWVSVVFNFSGTNFSASGAGRNLEGYAKAPCLHIASIGGGSFEGCRSGDVVQLSATSGYVLSGDVSWGGMTIDGISYPLNSFEIAFTSGSVILPFSDGPTITCTAPFSMTGFVVSRDSMGRVIGSMGLSGAGTASMILDNTGLFDSSGNRLYKLQTIGYSFVPTPEPATIVLLGTGLVGIASVALRRRYKNAK